MNHYIPTPTVVPFNGFNSSEDTIALRQVVEGLRTDEQAIINILTKRSNSQRQQIAKAYTAEFDRDLVSDLEDCTTFNLKEVIVGLMTPPVEYLCQQLHKAMTGLFGCNIIPLIEILCTRSNREIMEIKKTYARLYNRQLTEHICSVTKGDFRKFLTFIVTAVRNSQDNVNLEKAKEQAELLYAAGEARLGTDKAAFNHILARESHKQLRLVFKEYKNISGRTIKQALESELSGSLLKAMMAVVEHIENPISFYASQLHHAMAGLGTTDSALIRIIVSRCELDLGNIKEEYKRLYGKTLESDVMGDTSGDYREALIALVGGP